MTASMNAMDRVGKVLTQNSEAKNMMITRLYSTSTTYFGFLGRETQSVYASVPVFAFSHSRVANEGGKTDKGIDPDELKWRVL